MMHQNLKFEIETQLKITVVLKLVEKVSYTLTI